MVAMFSKTKTKTHGLTQLVHFHVIPDIRNVPNKSGYMAVQLKKLQL